MASRFTFTIRDWFWLCLVMFLAMGWGSHCRYSQWYERTYTNPPIPFTDDDLRAKMNEAIEKEREAQDELSDLKAAIFDKLDQDQIKQLEDSRKHHKKVREILANP